MIAPDALQAVRRLHFLRPSDEHAIKRDIHLPEFRDHLHAAVVDYLSSLTKPDDVDLDRVTVLAHQLHHMKFWDFYNPERFVLQHSKQWNAKVVDELGSVFRMAERVATTDGVPKKSTQARTRVA